MKTAVRSVATYVHQSPAGGAQVPDKEPGDYYVSCRDKHAPDLGTWLLLGPFRDDHARALSYVDTARACCIANDRADRAHWMAYGTVRLPHGHVPASPTVLVLGEKGEVLTRREVEQKQRQLAGSSDDQKN